MNAEDKRMTDDYAPEDPMGDRDYVAPGIDRSDVQQDSPYEASSEPEEPMGDNDNDGSFVPAPGIGTLRSEPDQ